MGCLLSAKELFTETTSLALAIERRPRLLLRSTVFLVPARLRFFLGHGIVPIIYHITIYKSYWRIVRCAFSSRANLARTSPKQVVILTPFCEWSNRHSKSWKNPIKTNLGVDVCAILPHLSVAGGSFFVHFCEQRREITKSRYCVPNCQHYVYERFLTSETHNTRNKKQTRTADMTLTNTALRTMSRAATNAIRQSAATPMVLHGTQRIQQSTRNFSSPIAIESSDNQEIATMLLMLSPSPPTNSNSLHRIETPSSRKETESQRKSDKTNTEDSNDSQRREEKKRELSHFLLWAESELKIGLTWCHRAYDARASSQYNGTLP